MSKRLFQILDEMNVADGESKTANVAVCSDFVEAKTAKGGGHVTIGVPVELLHEIVLQGNKMCVLLVINKKEYNRINDQP